MADFVKAVSLLLALLNSFLVIVYLLAVVQSLDQRTFRGVLVRAGFITSSVLSCFALAGDVIFSSIIQAEFASFQIFGGTAFLVTGLQLMSRGAPAIESLRGESQNLARAIAMPVLIGPGTLSTSVIIGKSLQPLVACIATALAVGAPCR